VALLATMTQAGEVTMHGRFRKRCVRAATATVVFGLSAAAHAALQDRDLDGDSVVDAYYDTDLNITWLRNANVNGPMTWADAVAWAAGYSIGAYADWRLPTTPLTTTGAACAGPNCTDSEMGHLWYVELGNTAVWPPPSGGFNRGGFQNFEGVYWSGTESTTQPATNAWGFNSNAGLQGGFSKRSTQPAMAVRDGDVTPVPEPQTYALMLLGIVGLALRWRSRTR
jgi:hypothetical protein